MVNVFISWQQVPGFTPDHVWFHVDGGGQTLNVEYAGTSIGTMITANSGDILHIEIFNSVGGVDSQHVTIDFKVP